MVSVSPEQQKSGPQCAEVAAAAAAAAAAGLGQTEECCLGADSEGTQLLYFGCHCCNTVNIIVCVKTPAGSWLLSRAPPAAAADAATAGEVAGLAEIVVTAPDAATETRCAEDSKRATGEAGSEQGDRAQHQEAPIKLSLLPAADRSSSVSSSGSSSRSGSSATSKRQCSEDSSHAHSRHAADDSGAPAAGQAAAAAAATAAVAIAAPAAKKDASRATLVLRPLATNSTASTCSSLWETADPRIADEAPTPIDAPTPQRSSPKAGRSLGGCPQQRQQQQKAQQKAGQLQRKEREQQPAGNRSRSDERAEEEESKLASEQALAEDGSSSHKQHVQEEQQGRGSRVKQPHEDETKGSAEEDIAAQQEQQQGEQQEDERGEGFPAGSSGNSSSHDDAISKMVAHMVTRECEGDGNCLYRAFSDQLYGSQEHHLFLRKLAVEVMRRCQATFEAFVDESEGPFDRWLQTKRTYGEWADYREMHALLLLFGAPIFVFDEHLQLLQTFEPDENRRLPSRPGEVLTPFRLMWHGKLGHYTSLHYLKEGFPIARGLTIGELEAEGLARLILSESSGDSSSDGPPGGPGGGASAGGDNEALAECLQVSAHELAGIAAEQALILAAIKRQRLQQLLPQTTKVVDALWNEAKKEQEIWAARLARGPRGSGFSSVSPAPAAAAHQQNAPWRVMDRPAAAAASAAVTSPTASEGYAASVHVSGPPFRTVRGASSGAPCSPSAVRFGSESHSGQLGRYTAANQQAWQQQQQVLVTPSPQVVRFSKGPPGPTTVSAPLGGAPGPAAAPPTPYRQHYIAAGDYSEQQRHPQCVRLADGRLVCVAPVEPMGAASMQQRQVELLQQQRAGGRPAASAVQQRQANSGGSKPAVEPSWLSRWMGTGNTSQGR
ncbi:hypothetical protein Efla_005597 [Eimeria flavescens]